MILIVLATHKLGFKRLLDAVQKQIDKGNIQEKVIAQVGHTDFHSNDMEIFDMISYDDFVSLVKKADLIITHGGVGCIMDAIKEGKKVIAAPRLKKYNEAENDHQLEIIEEFTKRGYILPLYDFDNLDKVLKEAKKFVPKKYKSNNLKMIKIIEDYIDKI